MRQFLEDPPLTGAEVYELAADSELVRRCIPENLVAALPRLEIVAGYWALQEGICPVEEDLLQTLKVRCDPIFYKEQTERFRTCY